MALQGVELEVGRAPLPPRLLPVGPYTIVCITGVRLGRLSANLPCLCTCRLFQMGLVLLTINAVVVGLCDYMIAHSTKVAPEGPRSFASHACTHTRVHTA